MHTDSLIGDALQLPLTAHSFVLVLLHQTHAQLVSAVHLRTRHPLVLVHAWPSSSSITQTYHHLLDAVRLREARVHTQKYMYTTPT